MPRSSRIDTPGAFHHVMIRGIERRDIFQESTDYSDFINRLAHLLPETRTICYAWVLMPNHAHFLFRSSDVGISRVMRRLLTGYVVAFNRRRQCSGHLFQNRYKSIICQEDIYFKELVRYIHLNPMRAGIVNDLEALGTYPYCGHSVLMGNTKQEWHDRGYVLRYFGSTDGMAIKRYVSYVEQGIGQGRREDLAGGGVIRSLGGWSEARKADSKNRMGLKGDERILGNSDFVNAVLSSANEQYERRYELKSLGYDLERVAARAGAIYAMEPRYVLSKGRQSNRVKARSLLCYWAVRELGIPVTELAARLRMSPSSVSYAVVRGEAIAAKDNLELAQ